MNNKTKLILQIVGFIGIMGIALLAYNVLKEEVEVPGADLPLEDQEKKVMAPDFTMLDENGEEIKLSELLGVPMVLNFWASWCPPCKEEMVEFEKVSKELGEEVRFVMLNSTDGGRETEKSARKFVEAAGLDLTFYYDIQNVTDSAGKEKTYFGEASMTYGISALPSTLFIKSDGEVVLFQEGGLNEKMLKERVDYLLEKELEE